MLASKFSKCNFFNAISNETPPIFDPSNANFAVWAGKTAETSKVKLFKAESFHAGL